MISGIIYSIVSVIFLPFLLFMQILSLFLFDQSVSQSMVLPYILALGIFLIPVILVVSNILMWFSIKKSNLKLTIIYMILPIIYTILFFLIWGIIDILL